jgi:hypothetical protein
MKGACTELTGQKIPLLSLLAYIDITCQHLPTFTLSSLTVHRFLIAGVCAGSKAQCDVFCTNAHYAKVGGIKVQELNALEREFLKVTQWNLCVRLKSVSTILTAVQRRFAAAVLYVVDTLTWWIYPSSTAGRHSVQSFPAVVVPPRSAGR